MESALNALGFTVRSLVNAPATDMLRGVQEFVDSVQVGTSMLFLNFCGHGFQSLENEDDLLPVDHKPHSPFGTEEQQLEASSLIWAREARGDDHHRGRRPSGNHALQNRETGPQGRAPLQNTSTSSPRRGDKRLSRAPTAIWYFTPSLLRNLRKAGDIRELLNVTKNDVLRDTGHRQDPAVAFNLADPEYLIRDKGRNPRDGLDYVYIPDGAFTMGCVSGDTECSPDELPPHKVVISRGFWMGRSEVTVEAYTRFFQELKRQHSPVKVSAPPSKLARNPVYSVSWEDAVAYCSWAGGKLPTEAQWEYAGRGGLDGKRYPWGNEILGSNGNFFKVNDQPAGVEAFAPNGFGLFDMAGNVYEWCSDFYDARYYRQSPAVDPPGPPSGRMHVKRGGSWASDAVRLRVSARKAGPKDNKTGFRCVLPDLPVPRR